MCKHYWTCFDTAVCPELIHCIYSILQVSMYIMKWFIFLTEHEGELICQQFHAEICRSQMKTTFTTVKQLCVYFMALFLTFWSFACVPYFGQAIIWFFKCLSIDIAVIATTYSHSMMTSSNGNIFRVTGNLCGEFPGPRWIPHTKASDAELCCLLWSAPE